MLSKVNIKGYKSIKAQVVDLGPINVLIGGNGVGKSNFISIFTLLRHMYEQTLQSHVVKSGGVNSLLHFGVKVTQGMLCGIEFKEAPQYDPVNRFISTFEPAQDRLMIKELSTSFNSNGTWHDQVFENNIEESDFRNIHAGQAYFVTERMKTFQVYHFHDTSATSPMKQTARVDDNHRLHSNGENIAAYLYFLQKIHPKHFKRIELAIQSVSPFFGGFRLQPDRLNPEYIKLEWFNHNQPEAYFNAFNLSDGTLRFICLATLLMQPDVPDTIIIDEPELGLHPQAIAKLAAMIRLLAKEDKQVILSSQSVNLVNEFEPEDIIVADTLKGSTTFRRLDSESLSQWLEEYTLGEIWENNIIGGNPKKA